MLLKKRVQFCYDCFVGLQIQRLGRVDSDFAPFVQHAGVPSVDVYYGKGTHLSQYELKDSV